MRMLLTLRVNNSVAGFLRMFAINYFLKKEFDESYNLGALRSKPNKRSLAAAYIGMSSALNHLGNVYTTTNLNFSRKIEHKVLEWSKKLIKSPKSVEGYISSGGTESNLFLMWMGREWLREFSPHLPALVISGFTHYSVSKSGRVMGIKRFFTTIDENYWGISVEGLEKTIRDLSKNGYKTFLLPITLGYSSTGAMDPLDEITKLIAVLQKELKIKCFVWVDAAMQGLSMAYLNNQYMPMRNSIVKGYVVDPHKLGLTPVPSGIVLYRKSLRKFISQPVGYLAEVDATLSGSRPGFSALAIWSSLVDYPQRKWKERFIKLSMKKKTWVEKLKTKIPNIKVISLPDSLTMAIVINDDFPRLPKKVEDQYGLYPASIKYLDQLGKEKVIKHYKIFFLSFKQRHDQFLDEIV